MTATNKPRNLSCCQHCCSEPGPLQGEGDAQPVRTQQELSEPGQMCMHKSVAALHQQASNASGIITSLRLRCVLQCKAQAKHACTATTQLQNVALLVVHVDVQIRSWTLCRGPRSFLHCQQNWTLPQQPCAIFPAPASRAPHDLQRDLNSFRTVFCLLSSRGLFLCLSCTSSLPGWHQGWLIPLPCADMVMRFRQVLDVPSRPTSGAQLPNVSSLVLHEQQTAALQRHVTLPAAFGEVRQQLLACYQAAVTL